jgi:hypothetical protein
VVEHGGGSFDGDVSPELFLQGVVLDKMISRMRQMHHAGGTKVLFLTSETVAAHHAGGWHEEVYDVKP